MSDPSRDRPGIAPWIEGAVLALVVLAILAFGGDVVRASYHGCLHASIGEAVLRGGLSPENPYHAGAPLRYYTLYPLLGAWIGRLGCGPFWGFALLDVLAALLIAPALDALGRALGLSFTARRACFLAAVLGFNGLGWIGFLVSSGDPLGSPPVYALIPMTLGREAFGWDARLQAFLPKFLNVSSFALALPFALWALSACAGIRRDRPGRSFALVSFALAASLALNPLVGGFAAVCAGTWLLPEFLGATARVRVAWALSLLAAVLLAVPFLVPATHLAPRGTSLIGAVALGGLPASNLLGPLLLLLVPGVHGLRRMPAGARNRFLIAAALAAAVVLAGEMPQGNEYKMSRLSGLLWAVPAGACAAHALSQPGWKRRVPIGLALLALPTTIAVPWAYLAWSAHAASLPLVVEDGRLAPRETALRPLFDAEARADPRAVVLMPPSFPGAMAADGLVQGNALAPALRHALFADLPQIHNDRHEDLGTRLALLESLYGVESDLPPAKALADARAQVAGRPILVFDDGLGAITARVLQEAGASELARSGDLALWSLPAAPSLRR